MQRALLQYFKPENYFDVRKALERAGREDLIGTGPECLIPEHPPAGARESRSRKQGRQGKGRDQERSEDRKEGQKSAGYRWAARRDGKTD
jgi:hypothetical protein